MPLFSVQSEKSNIYTKKVNVPQYLPSSIKPNISSLYDYKTYAKLLSEIEKAGISEDEKKFLRLAASRHIVFNYAKIADYYAHATKEMQQLMEESALVLIDVDDAIANGYVQLSKDIDEIMRTSGESTK